MPEKSVVDVEKAPFRIVEWGRTKILVSPYVNGSEHVRVGLTEYHPDTPHEPHAHPGQEEVIWVLSGRGYTQTGEEKIDLYPGAVAFIPAGMEHKTAVEEKMQAIIIKGPVRDADGVMS